MGLARNKTNAKNKNMFKNVCFSRMSGVVRKYQKFGNWDGNLDGALFFSFTSKSQIIRACIKKRSGVVNQRVCIFFLSLLWIMGKILMSEQRVAEDILFFMLANKSKYKFFLNLYPRSCKYVYFENILTIVWLCTFLQIQYKEEIYKTVTFEHL